MATQSQATSTTARNAVKAAATAEGITCQYPASNVVGNFLNESQYLATLQFKLSQLGPAPTMASPGVANSSNPSVALAEATAGWKTRKATLDRDIAERTQMVAYWGRQVRACQGLPIDDIDVLYAITGATKPTQDMIATSGGTRDASGFLIPALQQAPMANNAGPGNFSGGVQLAYDRLRSGMTSGNSVLPDAVRISAMRSVDVAKGARVYGPWLPVGPWWVRKAAEAISPVTGWYGFEKAADFSATNSPEDTGVAQFGYATTETVRQKLEAGEALARAAILAAFPSVPIPAEWGTPTHGDNPQTLLPQPPNNPGYAVPPRMTYPTDAIAGPLPVAPSSKLGTGPSTLGNANVGTLVDGGATPSLQFNPNDAGNTAALPAVSATFPLWALALGAVAILYLATRRG